MKEILSFGSVAEFVDKLRRNHPQALIAFTNGCFDILHRGHVQYLEKTKELADFLFVGLNSDASVRRLKGAQRPFMNEADRAFILSRLEAVDMVAVFEQDTPLELLQLVRPDLLIKGGDYTVENIVGRELVESYGGKVLTVPLVEGVSTTALAEKIVRSKKQAADSGE